ncbi:MAG TPA: ATP-binding domain-containing protein [Polyangiaceae bacterium]
MTLFTPRPRAARRRVPSLVDVVLDPAQKAAVERPAGRPLLVLGEAGVGKTTVALHRLAHLWRTSPPGSPLRAAVVVPTDGLVRLLQPALRKLGVDVEVLTYDRWAAAQARRAFRRLPRESDLTPPSVMALKRHPALRPVLEELAARPPGRIDDDVDAPARPSRARVTRGDLQHLFGDRVLLERVARAGGLSSRSVIDTLDRTRIQFSLTAEQEWAHVTDRERLVAVDHRGLDEGTVTGNAGTMDVEDYAVLFELERLRSTRVGHAGVVKPTYDLLMLDEAQELAPLELALLGRTMKPGGTLVVAGDAHQQTDETATFLGWDAAMRELGCPEHETVELAIGYRCPPDVVALAHAILEPARDVAAANATPLHSFPDERALVAWLAPGLRELRRRDPRASIAVVCRHPRTARRLTPMLQAAEIPSRVVFDGRFLARGPVQVSIVEEVKGLEFDFVVVPDAGAREYPDDAAARRAMYVAVTRARCGVAMACVGQGTRVLPGASRNVIAST